MGSSILTACQERKPAWLTTQQHCAIKGRRGKKHTSAPPLQSTWRIHGGSSASSERLIGCSIKAVLGTFIGFTLAKHGTEVNSIISHSGKIARGVRVPLDQLYNLKTLNVTAPMIDMALSNVLYELIDKSIPAKPPGGFGGQGGS